MRRGLLVISLIVLLIAPASAEVTFRRGTLTIAQAGRRVTLQIEVANSPGTRAHGLMNRPRLDESAGMLFIFEETASWAFWMKNTLIPLSIAFIDDQRVIVDIKDMEVAKDPEQGPFPLYQSAKPYRYALEVNQGFFSRHHLSPGAKISFTVR